MARPKRNYIPVITVVLLIALIVPISGAGFFPDGGTISDPVEITINSTIDAWTEVQPDAESLHAYRWRFNPAAFTIVSGDDHSRNVTFRAIRETKKPEAISYSRRDCSANSGKDLLCSTSEKASQKFWRIIRVSPPAAGISVKQSSEGRSASVRFTDLSTGSPSLWSWDFGDGWGSSDQNPEHTYEKSGKYTVTLRTANKGGDNLATTTVDVEIPEPVVNAVSPGPDTVSRAGSIVANGYPSGTVSVLHFNTPGSVSDEIGHVWHTENLLYSDTVYKFGGGSALFNGAAWLSTDDDPEFSPNSENFTFSAWVYPTSALNGYGTVWGNWWCCGVGGSSLDFMGGKPRIVIDNYGTKIITGTKPLPLNTWSNVVLQGKNVGGSSDVTLYVNGMPNGTLSGLYNIRKPVSQTKMFMGRSSTMFYLLQAGTYIDDFFIVKGGPAMYEGPFTPPTQEFGTPDPAHCGYDTCDDINDQTDYDACVACNSQTYCEGLCANPNCDLSGNQVTFGIENYTCSFGNWQIARCGQNALLNWALEGDTAQFNDVLSTARWRRTDSCPNMGHSYAFDNPGGKDVYMAGVVARDVGFFHEIAAELVGADPSNFDNWRFFNYGELNIIKGGGTLGFPIGQIPVGGTTCYTKVSVRKILGLNGCLVIDDPPQIVKTFYIDQSLQIQPNQNEPACGEHTTLKLLQRTQKSQNNYNNLPDELKKVLDSVKFTHQFATSRLDIDSVNQSITVYTYGIRDEQKMNSFDGRKANNYTIRMVHDTEFEKTVQDVKKHLNKFQDNPDYQISRISMVSDPFGNPPGNYIELWVNQLTPENKELDNTTIDGWMIQVYPESR